MGRETELPGLSPGPEELDFVRKAVDHVRVRSEAALARKEGEIRRLRAEVECLQIIKQRFESIVDTVPVIIFACNSKGDVTYINSSFTRLTGCPPEDALGAGWQSFTHPDDVEIVKSALALAIQSGVPRGSLMRMRPPGGEYVMFSATGTAVRDGNGKFLEWYGMLIPQPGEVHLLSV
ncbi:PAS domain-containing protein [Sphingosinicella sp.]|jgi:PAS domain S-box-containing protein|uniref:PAS domain-containing protein n=1 Tax=Sphingosinicella sp. TaxID=1917971 RepID=UPI0035AF8B10